MTIKVFQPQINRSQEVQRSALMIFSHSDCGQLLAILRPSKPWLPVDPRTLMKTPRTTDLRLIAPGEYGHYGLEQALERIQPNPILQAAEYVSLQFNVDGMNPFRDTNLCIWPILGRIIDPVLISPFLVGLYSGTKKPDDVNSYLRPFVEKLLQLLERGVNIGHSNTRAKICISSFVCDSPARAFIKRKMTHTGYFSCDHCVQRGFYTEKKLHIPKPTAHYERTQCSVLGLIATRLSWNASPLI
ncbi:unnamed protein product [Calicophoron daubneyi]|uniref:Transposase domain-containing protein n=1 Tax=Calicophoron daubneyi TaxID=300641 RepID=A0AAV2TFS9_CALDB